MGVTILTQADAVAALAAVSAYISGQPAPPPAPPVAPQPETIGPGTVLELAANAFMGMNWPYTLKMLLDTGQVTALSLGDISKTGTSAANVTSGQAALASLQAAMQAVAQTGTPPHVTLSVLPPVETGGYWFLVSYAAA